MSCDPNTPMANDIRSSSTGLVTLGTILTNAATQYFPVSVTVATIPNVLELAKQNFIIRQVTIRETANTGAPLKNDLLVYIWNALGATPPISGVVFSPIMTNFIATIPIVTADYKRQGAAVAQADVSPNKYYKSVDDPSSNNLYVAVIASGAPPTAYAASATLEIDITLELGQLSG